MGLLEKIPLTTVFNLLYLQKFREVDCRLLINTGLQRPPEGGEALVPKIPLRAEVVPSTPVRLTCHGFLFVPVLSTAASEIFSCTAGDWITYGACKTYVLMSKAGWLFEPIPVFVGSTKKERYSLLILITWLLKHFLMSISIAGVNIFFLFACKLYL